MNLLPNIPSARGEYPVYFQKELDEQLASTIKKIAASSVYVFTQKRIWEAQGRSLQRILEEQQISFQIFDLPQGEAAKTLAEIQSAAQKLLAANADRNSLLLAFGGGVVGDFTGFLASIFMRGIRWIQIPTSLLAMADASIGGKTAVNLGVSKNMLGSFYAPDAVFIAQNLLSSLDDRNFKSGLAEILKIAAITDVDFFQFLKENFDDLLHRNTAVLKKAIQTSIHLKAEVVSKDETETGLRAILNFGHTLGHAIEAASNFEILHGEAVAMGMEFAAKLSVKYAGFSKNEADALIQLCRKLHLPLRLNVRQILQHVQYDKKQRRGKLQFILLSRLGKAVIYPHIPRGELQKILEEI